MADFVADHPGNFIGRFGLLKQPAKNDDVIARQRDRIDHVDIGNMNF